MKMEIVLVEDYAHPIEKVWAALTDSAALEQWLMANDFEPQVSRRFTLRETPSDRWRGWADCEVLEMEAPNRMVWSWRHTEPGNPTRVEFRLAPIAGGHAADPYAYRRYRSGAGGAFLFRLAEEARRPPLAAGEDRLPPNVGQTIAGRVNTMEPQKIVSRDEWLEARKKLLERGKRIHAAARSTEPGAP